MTTRTIRNGATITVPVETGETLKIVAVTGTYTATIVRGTGIGTALATAATGGAYGPYAYAVVVSIVSSASSEIDFDVAVTPDVASDTVPSLSFDSSGNVTGLVGPGGVEIEFYKTPIVIYQSAIPSGGAPSGKIGTNGALTLGSSPAGSLSFAATSGSGVAVTGTGTTFVASDVGRAIIVDGKICTITAQSSPNCTVTITGTLSSTSFANNAWQLTSLFPFVNGPGGASSGIWLYFPAGAVYAGSVAGSYWTVMTTQAVGVVYNNILTLPGALTPPVEPIPVSATGPGAYTGDMATLRSVAGIVIPAGMMGLNGLVRVTANISTSNPVTSGTKNFSVLHGGAATNAVSLTTFTTVQEQCVTQNRGSTLIQLSQRTNLIGFGGSGTSTSVISNIDTSQAQPLMLQLQCLAASDYAILEGATIEVLTLE